MKITNVISNSFEIVLIVITFVSFLFVRPNFFTLQGKQSDDYEIWTVC